MKPQICLSEAATELLCCPVCRENLEADGEKLACRNPECRAGFPVVDGVPVLINESNSVFSIDDFTTHRNTTFNLRESRTRQAILGMLPRIGRNIRAEENYGRFLQHLLSYTPSPRVLVVGGSITGEGISAVMDHPSVEMVETDVSFGPRTMLVCDAHDIPFRNESFDGVIVQAVLEHVTDPYRCVEEIHRVLKPRALVFAEAPFMQQVHGGRYDFTRFTHLGLRRVFRKFEAIDWGATCGPGMALAWAYQYFFSSFSTSLYLRALLKIFTSLTSFYLKYFDHYLIGKPGTLDAASGFFFLGRKTDEVLPDRELVKLYRGMGFCRGYDKDSPKYAL